MLVLRVMLAGAACLVGVGSAAANSELSKKYNCSACHAQDRKVLGPSWQDVSKKYAGQADAVAKLQAKVKAGGGGVWGPVPMPPNTNVPDADNKALVVWILSGGK